jgi:multidrug efflux pump subunit AcrB
MQAMARMKGVADLETSLEKAKPELRVRVDRDRASDLGACDVIGTTCGRRW